MPWWSFNWHEKLLVLTGVGFRAALKGDTLNLQLGFSHDINFKIPKDKNYGRETNNYWRLMV